MSGTVVVFVACICSMFCLIKKEMSDQGFIIFIPRVLFITVLVLSGFWLFHGSQALGLPQRFCSDILFLPVCLEQKVGAKCLRVSQSLAAMKHPKISKEDVYKKSLN